MKRKFESLVDLKGLDDGGLASFTFEVDQLIKGKIYQEHWRDGKPSGYVIDDNCCWNEIKSKKFKENFKEI